MAGRDYCRWLVVSIFSISIFFLGCSVFNSNDDEYTGSKEFSGNVSFPASTAVASVKNGLMGAVNFSILRIWINGVDASAIDANGNYSTRLNTTSTEYKIEVKNSSHITLLKLITQSTGSGRHINSTSTAIATILEKSRIDDPLEPLKLSDISASDSNVQSLVAAIENVLRNSASLSSLGTSRDITNIQSIQDQAASAAKTMDEIAPLSITLTSSNASLTVANNADITVSVSGGSGIYSVSLSSSAGSFDRSRGTGGFISVFNAPTIPQTVIIAATVTDNLYNQTQATSISVLVVTSGIPTYADGTSSTNSGATTTSTTSTSSTSTSTTTSTSASTTTTTTTTTTSSTSSTTTSNQLGTVLATWIDVGQGGCILFEFPNGQNMMYDCGDNGKGDAEILPFLKGKGIGRLNVVILSHNHADHIGGFDEIVEGGVTVDEVWVNGLTSTTNTSKDNDQVILQNNISQRNPEQNYSRSFGNTEVLVLNSGTVADAHGEENEDCIVIKVTHGSISFLITGDAADEEGEDLVNDYGTSLDSTIMNGPHHGSKYFHEDLISMSSPKVTIFQVGANNSYEHPTQEAIDASQNAGATVYRTDTQGDITVQSDGSGYQVSKTK
ncbi:ComEC/Rec2 family competence protein [Candidatus Riflebacteria bacterium]